jgi:hypothetical protein
MGDDGIVDNQIVINYELAGIRGEWGADGTRAGFGGKRKKPGNQA